MKCAPGLRRASVTVCAPTPHRPRARGCRPDMRCRRAAGRPAFRPDLAGARSPATDSHGRSSSHAALTNSGADGNRLSRQTPGPDAGGDPSDAGARRPQAARLPPPPWSHPQCTPIRSTLRFALGVALAGAAIGLVPAVASTAGKQPTCTYDNGLAPGQRLRQERRLPRSSSPSSMAEIAARDAGSVGAPRSAVSAPTGSGLKATIDNTDRIVVSGSPLSTGDGYIVDQHSGAFAPGFTKEADGTSEIEILLAVPRDAAGEAPTLEIDGTNAADAIRVAARALSTSETTATSTSWCSPARAPSPSGAATAPTSSPGSATRRAPSSAAPLDRSTSTAKTAMTSCSEATVATSSTAASRSRPGRLHPDPRRRVRRGQRRAGPRRGDHRFPRRCEEPRVECRYADRRGAALAPRRARPGRQDHAPEHELDAPDGMARAAQRRAAAVRRRQQAGRQRHGTRGRPHLSRQGEGHGPVAGHPSRQDGHQQLALRLPRSVAGQSVRLAVEATDRLGHRQVEPDAGAIRVATS